MSLLECARGEDIAIGSRVYAKSDAKATKDGKSIDADDLPYPVVVERIDGDWLWVGSAKILRSDVFSAEEAISHFTQVIEKDPKDPYAYAFRARVWRGENMWSKAVDDYTVALKLQPTEPILLSLRAGSYLRMYEPRKAIDDYTDSIKIDPTIAASFSQRGLTFMMLQDYDKAIEDFREAIKLAPDNHVAYEGLGWIRATCPEKRYRNGGEAVEMGTKAAEITDWKSAGVLDVLAAAYAEFGDFPNAIKWQKQAMSLAPSERKHSLRRVRLSIYESGKPFRIGPTYDE